MQILHEGTADLLDIAADMLTDQGNCKFGANCALAHYLPDGRRVNRLILDEGESAASAPGSLIDLEGREKRALVKMQQDEQLSAKYEQFQSEQDVDEELRFQEMEQREKVLAEREARLSQDLHIEREKTARNRNAVTMAPDPVPTWTKADELEQVRQGVHRTINDQGPLSASPFNDHLSSPRWNSMRPALDNKEAIPRQAYRHEPGYPSHPTLEAINDKVRKVRMAPTFAMGESPRTISVYWGFSQFLKSQFEGPRPRIGSVLTLTGSVQNALATTCEAYLQSTWPVSGSLFGVLLQNISDAAEELYKSTPTGDWNAGKMLLYPRFFFLRFPSCD